MPAWLLSALALMGVRSGAGLAGRGLARRAVGGLGPAALGGAAFGVAAEVVPGLLGVGGGGNGLLEEPPKRRRRRRALTASDRADIAFITGLLGPTAGKNFALTVATRTG